MHRLLAALERIMEPLDSNIKSKIKERTSNVAEKIKLSSSVPNSGFSRRNNIHLKPKKTILKRPSRFFTEDCTAKDIDIPIDVPINLRIINDTSETSNISTDGSQSDCRDKIS